MSSQAASRAIRPYSISKRTAPDAAPKTDQRLTPITPDPLGVPTTKPPTAAPDTPRGIATTEPSGADRGEIHLASRPATVPITTQLASSIPLLLHYCLVPALADTGMVYALRSPVTWPLTSMVPVWHSVI